MIEPLENPNPERRKLMEVSDRYKYELEKDINEISVKTEKMLTNALIIGGSLALTYLAITQLTAKAKKSRRKKQLSKGQTVEAEIEEHEEMPSMLAQLGNRLVDQATVLLLDLAKDKLLEFIQSRKREDS